MSYFRDKTNVASQRILVDELEKREYERKSAMQDAAHKAQLGSGMNTVAVSGISDPYYTLLSAHGAAQRTPATPKPVIFGKLLWRG